MTRDEWHKLIDSETDERLAILTLVERSALEAHVAQANAIDVRMEEERRKHREELIRQRQEDREDAMRRRTVIEP